MQIPKYVIPAPHQVRDKLQRAYHRFAGSYHRLAVIQEAKNKMDPGLRRDDNKNRSV